MDYVNDTRCRLHNILTIIRLLFFPGDNQAGADEQVGGTGGRFSIRQSKPSTARDAIS